VPKDLAAFKSRLGGQDFKLGIVRAHADIKHHVDEYLAIIKNMQASDASVHSSSMYLLDMAKKVVHDAGAKTLARALPELARDHETYRRLFSLLLAVVVDVTKLPGAIAHRRHV